MINKKLINTTKYILFTIIAFFCVCNKVLAVNERNFEDIDGQNNTVDFQEGYVAPAISDAQDYMKDTSTSGTVYGAVSGTSCSTFTVSRPNDGYGGNVSQRMGKKTGPYIANQGNIIYNVRGTGIGCDGDNYVAFCLDPNFDGINKGTTVQYKAEQVNPNSEFGRRMFALYKVYLENGSPTDERSRFSYQVAARILAVQSGDYQSRSNTAKARYNSHLTPYLSGNVPGDNDGAALAAQALQKLSSMSDLTTTTLGLRLSRLGGTQASTNGYRIYVNAYVENCPDKDCLGANVTLNGGTLDGEPTFENGLKTFTFVLDGLGADCVDQNVTATLTYNAPNGDMRNAMQISPASKANDSRQNYIVFHKGNNGNQGGNNGDLATVYASLNINTCGNNNNDDNEVDACPTDAGLACLGDDENFVVINEGAVGSGSTDWEGCIIGKTDSQGNSYDVVNDAYYYKTTDQGNRTDEILGYTIGNSGGGAKTGDPHSIDDSNYCAISCKEKYAFILPGNKKDVKQGTYFSFQVDHQSEQHAVVGISAERLCVSSGVSEGTGTSEPGKTMNTSIFNQRVVDLRQQQVDFYNMYLYYKTMYNKMNEALNYYKNYHSHDAEVKMESFDPDDYYKVEDPNPSESTIRSWYNDKKWYDAWDGSDFNFDVPYCTVGNNTSDQINCNNTKRTNLSNTFRESGVPLKGNYLFYDDYYGDYNSTWNTEISFEELSSNKTENYERYFCEYRTWEYQYSNWNWEHEYEVYDWEYHGCRDHTFSADVKYYDGDVDSQFNAKFETFKAAYQKAIEKYNALNAQIGVQSDAMQECTNYFDDYDNKYPYRFDPIVVFSYEDQDQYMNLLKPNKLENMNKSEAPQVNYQKYQCEGNVSASDVFRCGSSASPTSFKFGRLIENADSAENSMPTDETVYYNVSRVGSRSTFGRYTSENQEGCSSSYRPDSGSRSDYCYEFYQSAKQFYTTPPDGLATINPTENSTLLSTDGRVYPVTITTSPGRHKFSLTLSNIGQYGESSALGRIMGGDGNKQGTLSGEYGDEQVCYYEVCRFDDPDCNNQESDDKYCGEMTEADWKKYCNNGQVSDPLAFTKSNYNSCINKLLEAGEDCCSNARTYLDMRPNDVEPRTLQSYYSKCKENNECSSIRIVDVQSYSSGSNLSDVSNVFNSGSLQMNARSVSLNNLFPNSESGINWNSDAAQKAIVEIQSIGDGIFGDDSKYLDYSFVIDSNCARALQEYNKTESGSGSGYGNGGFNDYTNKVNSSYSSGVESISTSELSQNDTSKDRYGAAVYMSESFKDIVEQYCSPSGNKWNGGEAARDVIVDKSSLVLEPWNK